MKTLLAFVVGAAACSSNPLDPGAGSSPGSGTGTLMVEGRAIAEPVTPNASAGTSFTTSFDIDITLNGAPVTDGTVTLTSRFGKTLLAFAPDANHAARWSGDAANYDEVYQLDVVSGADKINSVIVDGPDIHTFTAPMLGASVDPSMPLSVAWHREAAAQLATIRADKDPVTIPDSGTYMMAALSLAYEKDQTKTNTLRLTRTNSIVPKGAVAGSSFTVGVANELDVVATACPSCP